MRQAGNPIDAPWEGGRWGFFFEVAFLITLRRCKAWFPLLFVFQDRFKFLGQSCQLVWIRFLADSLLTRSARLRQSLGCGVTWKPPFCVADFHKLLWISKRV